AVAWKLPPTKRSARAGDVEQDRRPRLWQFFQTDFLLDELEQAAINETLITFGAGKRYLLAVAQNLRRFTRADNCRNAELATHDGCVARAPAEIGDDPLGFFENRPPIGIRHLR